MPHFDNAGAHADDYDIRSMWISCRHDPDSKAFVQYDPYTELWHLSGIYDAGYTTPEDIIAAGKRQVAANCRYRYRRGGAPDQDTVSIRARYDEAIAQFHTTPRQGNPAAPQTAEVVQRIRLTLEQALDETIDLRRADADRLEAQLRQGNIFTTPEAEQQCLDHRQTAHALYHNLDSLIKAAGLPHCRYQRCLREPASGGNGLCL